MLPVNRRKLLSAVGTAGVITVAGCSNNGGSDNGSGNETNTNETDSSGGNSSDDEQNTEYTGPKIVTVDAKELSATDGDIEGWTRREFSGSDMTEEERQGVFENFNRHGTLDTFDIAIFNLDTNNAVIIDQTIGVMETTDGAIEYIDRNGGAPDGEITEELGDEQRSQIIEDENVGNVMHLTVRHKNVILEGLCLSEDDQTELPLEEGKTAIASLSNTVGNNVEELAVPTEE